MPAAQSSAQTTTPPASMACTACADGELRLISVEPEAGRVLYVYECRNKHRRELVVGDQ
jgi:hypothetical protein